MNIDWAAVSAIVSAIALLCSGSVLFFGYAVSNKILNNDLVHVQASLDRIEKDVRTHKIGTEEFTKEIVQRVARIEGNCQARHKSLK